MAVRRTKPQVSVIIPSRKEKYLRETLEDLYENRAGAIEVFVVLDGEPLAYEIPEYPHLRVIQNQKVEGMRACINKAAALASGKYLMKMDDHCTIGHDWDKILKSDCEDNWIVVPRRFWFNAQTWAIIEDKPHVDAMSYLYPFLRPYRPRLTCRPDTARAERDKDELLVEDMGFQGSLWFMTRKHFERLGGMSEYGYGTFAEEPQELGLKTQLGPWKGKVMRNKKTWYAHWSKPSSHWRGNPDEMGRAPDEEREAGYRYCFDYWWNNRWDEQVRSFQWLAEKFWPLPTWPDNWKWEVTQFNRYELSELWQSQTATPI